MEAIFKRELNTYRALGSVKIKKSFLIKKEKETLSIIELNFESQGSEVSVNFQTGIVLGTTPTSFRGKNTTRMELQAFLRINNLSPTDEEKTRHPILSSLIIGILTSEPTPEDFQEVEKYGMCEMAANSYVRERLRKVMPFKEVVALYRKEGRATTLQAHSAFEVFLEKKHKEVFTGVTPLARDNLVSVFANTLSIDYVKYISGRIRTRGINEVEGWANCAITLFKALDGEVKNLGNDFFFEFSKVVKSKREKDEKEINASLEKFWGGLPSYKEHELIAVPLKTVEDFATEGLRQGNCVRSYAGTSAAGSLVVYSVRKVEAPEESFITLSLNVEREELADASCSLDFSYSEAEFKDGISLDEEDEEDQENGEYFDFIDRLISFLNYEYCKDERLLTQKKIISCLEF